MIELPKRIVHLIGISSNYQFCKAFLNVNLVHSCILPLLKRYNIILTPDPINATIIIVIFQITWLSMEH